MLCIVRRLASVSMNAHASIRSLAAASSSLEREGSKKWALPKSWNRTRLPRPPPKFKGVFSFFASKNGAVGVPAGVQSKRLSALWESLSDVEKQIYRDAHAEHLATYEERYKTFLEGLTPQERILITEYKKIRPRNAVTLFLLDHYYHEDGTRRTEDEYEAKLGYKSIARDVIGRMKLMLRSKELREKWKSLTAEQKEHYQEKSRKTLIRRGKSKSIEMVTVKPQPRPLNAFTSFLLDHYYHEDGTRRTEDEYEAELGHKSIARDVIGFEELRFRRKELFEKWKSLTAEQKEPYWEKSRKALVEQVKAYELALEPKSWNRSRLPRPPPKFKGVFSFFASENSVIGVRLPIQLGRLSALWESLSDVEKQIYQDAYAEHLAIGGEPYKTFLEGLTPQERTLITEYKKIRPQHAFSLFVLDHYYHEDGTRRTEDEYEAKLGYKSIARDVIGGMKLMLRNKELGKKWKSLTAEQKELYREKSRKTLIRRGKSKSIEMVTAKPQPHPPNAWLLLFRDHWYHEDGTRRTEDEYEAKLGHKSIARDAIGREKFLLRMKELREKWKSLTAEQKEPYQEKSRKALMERVEAYV